MHLREREREEKLATRDKMMKVFEAKKEGTSQSGNKGNDIHERGNEGGPSSRPRGTSSVITRRLALNINA